MSMGCPDLGDEWLVAFSPLPDQSQGPPLWQETVIPASCRSGSDACSSVCGLDRPVCLPPFLNSLGIALDSYQHCDW